MDHALVKNAKNDVDGDQGSDDQNGRAAERALESLGVTLEAGGDRRRQVEIGGGFCGSQSPHFQSCCDYLGLRSRTITVPAGGFLAGDTFTIGNPNVQMVKFGVNYLFNGPGRY
jgi:hypothetical protein